MRMRDSRNLCIDLKSWKIEPHYGFRQWLTRPKLDPLEMISENKAVIGFNLIWLWDQGGNSIEVTNHPQKRQTIGPNRFLEKNTGVRL